MEEKLLVNNKDNIVFMFRNYRLIVAPWFRLDWKFDVLKTGIFAFEPSLLGQLFVLRTLKISVGQLSANSSSTETLYCLNKNLELII